MIIVIDCVECGFTTNIDLTNNDNPKQCPECEGMLVESDRLYNPLNKLWKNTNDIL